MFGVIKVNSLINGLNFIHDLFLLLFFNKRAGSTSLLAQVATDWLVEVYEGDNVRADVRLLKLSFDLRGDSDHTARGTTADAKDERLSVSETIT